MNGAEHWECVDCYHRGPLDIHGRCDACKSNNVIAVDLLDLLAYKATQCATTHAA